MRPGLPTYFPVPEAASLLGVGVRAVRKAIEAGRLSAREVAGRGRGGVVLEVEVGSLPHGAIERLIQLESHQPSVISRQQSAVRQQRTKKSDGQDAHPPLTATANQEIGAPRETNELEVLAGLEEGRRRAALWRRSVIEECKKFEAGFQGNATDARKLFVEWWNRQQKRSAVSGQPSVKSDNSKSKINGRNSGESRHLISYGTLNRWIYGFEKEGIGALVDGKRGGRKGTLSEAEKEWFRERWLNQNKPKVKKVYREYERWCAARGASPASYDAMNRYARSLEEKFPALVCRLREGEKAYRDRFDQFVQGDQDRITINERWNSDHHQLDVQCWWKGRLVNPWVTLWQDCRSRMIVGWEMTDKPNGDTIMISFYRAAMAFGLPKQILIDNGKDYRGKRFTGDIGLGLDEAYMQGIYAGLNISVRWALPYNARVKQAEPWFKFLEDDFCKNWISYRGKNPQDKPERMKSKVMAGGKQRRVKPGEIPQAWEIEQAFGGWVEWFNHEHSHTGRGMEGRSPRECWDDDLKSGVTLREADETALRLFMMKPLKATPSVVHGNGIEFQGLHWWADEFLSSHLLGTKVWAKYEPKDMGVIGVFDLDGRFLFWAHCDELHNTPEEQFVEVQRRRKLATAVAKQWHDPKTQDAALMKAGEIIREERREREVVLDGQAEELLAPAFAKASAGRRKEADVFVEEPVMEFATVERADDIFLRD